MRRWKKEDRERKKEKEKAMNRWRRLTLKINREMVQDEKVDFLWFSKRSIEFFKEKKVSFPWWWRQRDNYIIIIMSEREREEKGYNFLKNTFVFIS